MIAHATPGAPALAAGVALLVVVAVHRAGARPTAGQRRRDRAAVVAVTALLAALVWPLEPLAHHGFAGHMAQHLVLTAVAAPALAMAALPRAVQARAGVLHRSRLAAAVRRLRRRGPAWLAGAAAVLYLGVLAAWHVPALYDRAVDDGVVHVVEHASLLGSAVVLWSAVLAAARRAPAAAVGSLFVASVGGGLLGALLTFAGRPWYGAHRQEGSPLADQHLGGVLLWVPGSVVFVAGAVAVVAVALQRAGRSAGRRTNVEVLR